MTIKKSYQESGPYVQMQKLLLIVMKNAGSPEENSGLFVFEVQESRGLP